METSLPSRIFDLDKIYGAPQALFLQNTGGLYDTVNRRHPDIYALLHDLRSRDWTEYEFDFKSCLQEFKSAPKPIVDKMLKTIAFQWETDSVISRMLLAILSLLKPDDDVLAFWTRVSDQENVHSMTYSEILRTAFDDPREVINTILSYKKSFSRLSVVANVLNEVYETALKLGTGQLSYDSKEAKRAVVLFVICMWVTERLSFMGSFPVTFAITGNGKMFLPIGRAVQKICTDEFEVHQEFDSLLVTKLMVCPHFGPCFDELKTEIKKIIDDVHLSEFEAIDYIHEDGEELPGVTPDMLKDYVRHCGLTLYRRFSMEATYGVVEENPLPYMDDYIQISKTLSASQESKSGDYLLGAVEEGEDLVADDIFFS